MSDNKKLPKNERMIEKSFTFRREPIRNIKLPPIKQNNSPENTNKDESKKEN